MTYTDFIKSLDTTFAIVAHRGAWHNAPENSLLSLQHCIDAKCDIIEVDIQQSRDGVLFAMHDTTLKRVVGVDTDPQSLTIRELQNLKLRHADGGNTAPITDCTIPTLAEFLDMAQGKIYIDLDAKYRPLIPAIAKQVKSQNMQNFVSVKDQVTCVQDFQKLQDTSNQIKCLGMPIMRFKTDTWQQQCAILPHIDAVLVESKFDTLDTLQKVYEYLSTYNIKIWGNTLMCSHTIPDYHDDAGQQNPDAVWGTLFNTGIHIFQTDALDTVLAYRNIKGKYT